MPGLVLYTIIGGDVIGAASNKERTVAVRLEKSGPPDHDRVFTPNPNHLQEVVDELKRRSKPSLAFHMLALANVGIRLPDNIPTKMVIGPRPAMPNGPLRALGHVLHHLIEAGAPLVCIGDHISGHAELCESESVLTLKLFPHEPDIVPV